MRKVIVVAGISLFAVLAYRSIFFREQLSWLKAKTVDTEIAYDQYLRDWPLGGHAGIATTLRDERAWQSSGPADYLERYPNGVHVADALRIAEADVWKRAQTTASIESYKSYLTYYPMGQFAEAAREKLNALEAEAAEDSMVYNLVRQYNEFIPLAEKVEHFDALFHSHDDELGETFRRLPPGVVPPEPEASPKRNTATVGVVDAPGPSPLDMAAALRKRLVDIARDRRGERALAYAIDGGHYYTARDLLKFGIEVHDVSFDGLNAPQLAARKGEPRMIDLINEAYAKGDRDGR